MQTALSLSKAPLMTTAQKNALNPLDPTLTPDLDARKKLVMDTIAAAVKAKLAADQKQHLEGVLFFPVDPSSHRSGELKWMLVGTRGRQYGLRKAKTLQINLGVTYNNTTYPEPKAGFEVSKFVDLLIAMGEREIEAKKEREKADDFKKKADARFAAFQKRIGYEESWKPGQRSPAKLTGHVMEGGNYLDISFSFVTEEEVEKFYALWKSMKGL